MRATTILTLSTLTLVLAACGSKGGKKIPLRKSLGPGGLVTALGTDKKGCLRLDETLKTIAARTDGLILHTRDYDLGTMTAEPRFVSSPAEAERATRVHRALKGPGSPTLQTASDLKALTLTVPADGLLGIASQTACATVKFNSGIEFKVVGGGPRSAVLHNQDLGELRVYTLTDADLTVDVVNTVSLKNCDGSASAAKVEKVSHRLAWGEAAGSVKLAPEFARALDVPVAAAPAEKANPRAHAKVTPPKDAVLPGFSFQNVVRQVPALAAKSVCAP